jgi:hypothetical protein
MSASTSGTAQPAPGPGRRKRVALTVLLAWAVRLPWDRRFQLRVILLAIFLGAMRGLARDGGTRVVAWDARSRARSLEAQAKKAAHHAKEAVSGG